MTANPVLAEARRGGQVENLHRGAFCVAGADASVLASAGDIDRRIFPRSAVKSIQAMAVFRSGAVEKFKLGDEMLALACASHSGEARHVDGVRRFLAAIGLTEADLECGAHPPGNAEARRAWRASGAPPSAVFSNCSGKHAGMLAVASALGAPTAGYVRRDHPAQKLVRACVETVLEAPLADDFCGTDGCSIPTWGTPLRALAAGFARMATGQGMADADAAAARRIVGAATAHPFLVSGTDRLDTDAMTLFEGRLMLKGGAEGVYCGALRDTGTGFALKIDDGRMQAAEAIAAALIEALGSPGAAARSYLRSQSCVVLRNWRGMEVGEMSATELARPAI
ncbi:MAG TPA: asparaginase [Devosiaceae bacterium]|nr:asparaginase [Devosiaceae bacterium]